LSFDLTFVTLCLKERFGYWRRQTNFMERSTYARVTLPHEIDTNKRKA